MHELLVMAQPTTEKGAGKVQERLGSLHEFYEDLMWLKTPDDRANEKKQRVKESWLKIRAATGQMREASKESGRKKGLKINWEKINAKRKSYAEKFLGRKKEGG